MPEPISILTPIYNGEPFVNRCYNNLCQQTIHDWEWVVVDDGSTDRTHDMLQAIAATDRRVRVFRHSPNRGRGFARTRTLEHARYEWSALNDVDDLYFPERLAIIDTARTCGVDFLCSYALIVNEELQVKGTRGFFDFLGLRTFVHATLAYRTKVARSIGYEAAIATVGQIGEDHRMGLVLPARYKGLYHPDVLMINQEDREVFLLKAIHSNRIRLRIIEELGTQDFFPVSEETWRTETRRIRRKLAVLNAMRIYPPIYLRTVKHRSYGEVVPGYAPSVQSLDYLGRMRALFPPRRPPSQETHAEFVDSQSAHSVAI